VAGVVRFFGLVCVVGVVACGDHVTILECPPGTVAEGSKCVPHGVEDTTVAPDDTSVGPGDTTTDTVAPNDTLIDSTSATDATEPGDTVGPDTSAGPTGAACQRNADCAGGTCLDWTNGYCTHLDCQGASCGDGELCLAVLSGNNICIKSCTSDADCRTPDQACKRVADGGDTRQVCVGVDVDAGGAGAACSDPTECAGQATCLSAFPGGYCAALGCPSAPCGAGSTCVRVDGRPSCLATCASDDVCHSAVGAERKCGVLEGVAGAPVQVCISGISGKAMGASCLSDFECSSGSCEILGEGRCSQTQRPCFPDHVADDCNGAESCIVTGQNRVGVCSQPCRPGGIGCPGASYCIAEADNPNDGWCRPACTSAGADPACNADAGMRCAFGIPITDGAQGRYVCARARTGVLTSCSGSAACGDNQCLAHGNSGYCVEGCGDDGYCPFGGTCVVGTSAGDRCQRSCFSGLDCPTGFSCTLATGATRTVCE